MAGPYVFEFEIGEPVFTSNETATVQAIKMTEFGTFYLIRFHNKLGEQLEWKFPQQIKHDEIRRSK